MSRSAVLPTFQKFDLIIEQLSNLKSTKLVTVNMDNPRRFKGGTETEPCMTSLLSLYIVVFS